MLNAIGKDDSIDESIVCQEESLEYDDFRVAIVEIGFLDKGPIEEQGVIWLKFVMEDQNSSEELVVSAGE